jgi:predicted esterase
MTQIKQGPHQGQQVYRSGQPLEEAHAAMVLVHGRGASAQSILELGHALHRPDFAYLAPQAAGHTWYPYSFLAPLARNEPGLASGLQAIGDLVAMIEDAGIPRTRIVIGGFSQGACLASEYVARNAGRYGGLLIFSGGLIGPLGMSRSYEGSLEDTPVFLGCSDRDFHIPLERVEESASVLSEMGGNVIKKIYPGMGHTIVQDEIDAAMRIVAEV